MPKPILYKKFINLNYKLHVIIALFVRIVFIIYGTYHDEISNVPYTDVDYKVFTDASRHVLNNSSPYERHTYRYTPLIAYLLIPNILIHISFGKVFFSIIDIIVGLLIRVIVKNSFIYYNENNIKSDNNKAILYTKQKKKKLKKNDRLKNSWLENETNSTANISMILWLYNPMTIAIATRGNCDSIAAFLVLFTQYLLQIRKNYFLAGILHGTSIHVRLYPIVYSLSLYMYLSKFAFYSDNWRKKANTTAVNAIEISKKRKQITDKTKDTLVKNDLPLPEKKTIFRKAYLLYLVPNYDQIQLIFGCIFAIALLSGIFYYLYGHKFLYETYIYHFIRNDTRHNFSVYFYLQYLTHGVYIGLWQKVLIILPQLVLLLVFSIRYGLNKLSLNFSLLTQTIIMVTYNTVLTSQYFIWILCVLPLSLWQIKMKKRTALFLILIWFAAQVAWLLPAYFLEFHGQNTFLFIWMQSVSFFCANIAILGRLIINYMPTQKTKSN